MNLVALEFAQAVAFEDTQRALNHVRHRAQAGGHLPQRAPARVALPGGSDAGPQQLQPALKIDDAAVHLPVRAQGEGQVGSLDGGGQPPVQGEEKIEGGQGRPRGLPAVAEQKLTATISAQTRLQTPEQFRAILLKVNPDGSNVTLGDVTRVELAGETYEIETFYNGRPSGGIGIKLAAGANALQTVGLVRDTGCAQSRARAVLCDRRRADRGEPGGDSAAIRLL